MKFQQFSTQNKIVYDCGRNRQIHKHICHNSIVNCPIQMTKNKLIFLLHNWISVFDWHLSHSVKWICWAFQRVIQVLNPFVLNLNKKKFNQKLRLKMNFTHAKCGKVIIIQRMNRTNNGPTNNQNDTTRPRWLWFELNSAATHILRRK